MPPILARRSRMLYGGLGRLLGTPFNAISAMTDSTGKACPANPCNHATGTNPSC
ncbi:MAG: hypothetical protein ACAF42_11830 [Limnothrix sp. BL-A-16]